MTGSSGSVGAVLAQTDEPLIRWSWVGDHLDQIWDLLVQHLELTFIAVGVGFVIAFALALVALQWRPVYTPVNAVTGIMYAIPSLALFVLLVPITGLTTLTAEIACPSRSVSPPRAWATRAVASCGRSSCRWRCP